MHSKYSSWSSWAIWNPSAITDLAPISSFPSPHAWTNGTPAQYRNDLVVVGLNATRSNVAWQNYHFNYRGCRDTYLRSAFNNSKLGGAYMTDLFRHTKATSSARVVDELSVNVSTLPKAVADFCKELDDLWSGYEFTESCRPCLLLLGRRAFDMYSRHFASCPVIGKYNPRAILLPHHAAFMSEKQFVAKVGKAIMKGCPCS